MNQSFISKTGTGSDAQTSLYQPTLGNRISATSYNNSALTCDLYINGSATQQSPYPLDLSGSTFTGYSSGDTYTSAYLFDDSTGGNAWEAWLADYVIVTGTLSTENRQKIEGYLAHKWGQLSLLPSDHPYKTTAPSLGPAPTEAPVNLTPPVVSGVGYNGQTLSTTNGTWTNSPSGFTYQWQSNSVNITGATSSAYQVTSTTEGTSLTCDVTATNAQGSSTESSNAIHNFVPTDLGNTEIWVDASDVSTITDSGGNVSDWDDKSGNNNDYSQNTASLRPRTGLTTVNGLNVIEGDDVNDVMSASISIAADQNIHVILLGSFGSTGQVGGDVNYDFVGSNIRNLNVWNQNFVDKTGTGSDNQNTLYSVGIGNKISATSYNNSALTCDLYINGSATQQSPYPLDLSGSTFTGYSSGDTYTSAYLFDDSTGGNAWEAWLADYVIVTGTLSTENRQKIEGYLAHKWGQLSLLPSGHPHKTTAPSP